MEVAVLAGMGVAMLAFRGRLGVGWPTKVVETSGP